MESVDVHELMMKSDGPPEGDPGLSAGLGSDLLCCLAVES